MDAVILASRQQSATQRLAVYSHAYFARLLDVLRELFPCVRHAVGDEHTGSEYASVIYIGSAPDCPKNRAYLPKQREAFLEGRSAPDFAAMDLEVGFKGRATASDLTDLGRAQMGFSA